jgi:hypothetical protein
MDAREIIKQLDGMSIDAAKRTLEHAITLLTATQTVSKDAPLLEKSSETTDSASSIPA